MRRVHAKADSPKREEGRISVLGLLEVPKMPWYAEHRGVSASSDTFMAIGRRWLPWNSNCQGGYSGRRERRRLRHAI